MTFQREDLKEIYSVKPTTARVLSLALITKCLNARKAVKAAETNEEKCDALSDMILNNAYLLLLSIAIDQNDATLIKKIKR